MAETKIGFSVQDNGVLSHMDRMKRSADELGRGMIRDARAYSSSGKEVVSFIEEQIKAIEKRNKLDEQSQKLQIEQKYRSGSITEDQKKTAISGVQKGTDEDRQQVILLRELIDTTKQTAKSEIVESRKQVEREIAKDKSINQLGIKGDEMTALKKTLQRQYIGDTSSAELSERDNFNMRGKAQGASNYLGGLAMSKNEFYALAGVAAAVPIVGQAASMLFQKALGSAEGYQKARGGVFGVAGGVSDYGGNMSRYGYTMEDFMGASPQMMKARGTSGDYGSATRDMLLMEKGMGIDRGATMGLETMLRSDVGGKSARQQVMGLYGGLAGSGAISEGDTAAIPEYLQILTQIGQKQVEILGSVDTGLNTEMLLKLSNLDDSFKNPAVLRGVMNSMQAGLQGSSTPQIEAMQFAALSRINPGASLLDMEEMRENPFSNPEYLQSMLGMLQGASMNDDGFVRNIKNTFGTSVAVSKKIAGGFGRGDLKEADFKDVAELDLEKRAGGATGSLESATARVSNVFAEKGDMLANKMAEMMGKFDEYINILNETNVDKKESDKEMANVWRDSKVAEDENTGALTKLTNIIKTKTANDIEFGVFGRSMR